MTSLMLHLLFFCLLITIFSLPELIRINSMSLIITTCLMICGCAPVYRMAPRYEAEKVPSMMIRVIIDAKNEIVVSGKTISVKGNNFRGNLFKANNKTITLDRHDLTNIQFPVELMSNNIMIYDDKQFRGSFSIHKKGELFMVVNKLDIEDYLKGVVACELRTDELETSKAQAVACRSFALHSIRPERDYDVTCTFADQVYAGVSGETDFSNKAIEETKGIVATYDGKVILAQYSSTCGGRTRNGNAQYLKSRTCRFCEKSPHYEWNISYQKQDFFHKLGVQGTNIKIEAKDSSGRIEKIMIGSTEFRGEELRSKLNLKSRFFDIKTRGNEIIITGKGYGHGIGLCQYGAVEMAKRGFNYKSILEHYYSDIKTEKIY